MLNMLGGNRIYVVPEIHFLLEHLRKFKIIGVDVDALPAAEEADRTCAYYKATGNEVEVDGTSYPSYSVFIPAEKDGEWVWYTTSCVADYTQLANLPYYQLTEGADNTTFQDDVTEVLAQAITDEEIASVFDDEWPIE